MCSGRNILCKYAIILIGVLQITNAAWLRCYKGSLNEYLVAALEQPLPIANCLNPSLPTVIYTFGYRGRVQGPATTAIMGTYLATKKRNVVLLDWEEEAKSGLLGIPLSYLLHAVPNAKKIGNEMGVALIKLARSGVNMTQVHLLGHSLGAHIMGYAGRRAREYGHVVSRITGLDPARALFEGSVTVQNGLDRTCAKFVDIIHSDPGGYGTSTSKGTVDIWPNYAGNGGLQPGCPGGNFNMFSIEDNKTMSGEEEYNPVHSIGIKYLTKLETIRTASKSNLCSHDRSWRYFVETITSPTSFPAAGASDYNSWVANYQRPTQTIYMGDLINSRARGNFFLTTNSRFPYGKGREGLIPDDNQARRRRRNSPINMLLRYLT